MLLGKWNIEELERFPLKGDRGLVLLSESRHAAVSSKLDKPFKFDSGKILVIQYEVAFQKPHTCGGAYLKLLTDGPGIKDLIQFNDKTPYSIMFGPDKCGPTSKVHFIIRHKNPKNNSITEKHCLKLKTEETVFTDHQPHLFTLIVKPDNSYSFFLDQEVSISKSIYVKVLIYFIYSCNMKVTYYQMMILVHQLIHLKK